MLAGFFAPGREVRIARVGDAARCAALHAAAFLRSWSEEDFESFLTDPAVLAHVVIRTRPERIDGFVLSRMAAGEAEILSIAVDPSCRGKGLAGQLLARHKAGLEASGIRRLFLEVSAENAAARALYARAGFTAVGARKGYYPLADGRRADALVLCCEQLG